MALYNHSRLIRTFNRLKTSFNQLKKYPISKTSSDENQVEEASEAQSQEAQAQPMSSTSFMPQRITRSKAKVLGDEHHLMTLFVITFV